LSIWHPDIEEFITAKQTPNKLTKFNIAGNIGAGEVNAAQRAENNDTTGKWIDRVGSVGGVMSTFPNPMLAVPGAVLSGGALATNLGRDIQRAREKYSGPPILGGNKAAFPVFSPATNMPQQPQAVPAPAQPIYKKSEATYPLTSSNIKAVGYDKSSKSLDVAFHSGSEYKYSDIPKSIFDRLKKAKSPGKFFHKHIKLKEYPYEKVAEYKWHKSKNLHRDITAGRHYPFSFLTGEAKELLEAVKNKDWNNFKEEIGDTTYAAQMLAAQATGLNHPVYADLKKFYDREKVWKDLFKAKNSVYHPRHMQGGSNFAKPSKIIKALESAGVKINQAEAERLANHYTGGKMEKEAAGMPEHIRKAILAGDKATLRAGQAAAVKSRAKNKARSALRRFLDMGEEIEQKAHLPSDYKIQSRLNFPD
jgi:NTP pyrophosphatase (non-canonical NTP hydrolase)